ncbi:helix-turn-helix domain-containing protein [Microlunatus soli]|uniref:Helix-turn-helix domain-containing protein n=1 Tax=Microlunatus soli TaxID=630515 RepID=A0A1H2AG46_9ACTN|nr:XRE family transcriptional regulator [Microlunatus soli]SDT44910.1 Helix-turn-helix domain-containing protein [Microlunatus soli]
MVGANAVAVGRRLTQLREGRRLSLSELARRAGIGKGTLSEIESGRRNPTLETLYALTLPLQVPLTALLGEAARTTLSPDADGPAITGHSGMSAITLDVRHQPDGSTVEVFRLEFPAGASHESPAHGPEVREHLTVGHGRLRVGPTGRLTTLTAGQSRGWTSNQSHRYVAVDGPAEAIVVIVSPADR